VCVRDSISQLIERTTREHRNIDRTANQDHSLRLAEDIPLKIIYALGLLLESEKPLPLFYALAHRDDLAPR
jgi:hypothetical protein